ncbi:MAG: hypothetical protein ABIY52_00080 [Gemmatimonadaceae bacterium]
MRRALAALFMFASACAPQRRADDGAPVLAGMSPDSVQLVPGAVVEVTLTGSAFHAGDAAENIVHFGHGAMRHVRANDAGTRIVFTIPDVIDSGGEAPPMPLATGDYAVRVETPGGRSNALVMRVFR